MLNVFIQERFVDDILVVVDIEVDTDSMLVALNSFSNSIICTNDGAAGGKRVVFLDLNINISENLLDYSTHRKPLATYGYTPYDSNHAASTL